MSTTGTTDRASWLTGTWLVTRRSLLENVRSRTYRVVTVLLVLIAVGAVVVPLVVGDDDTTYTLATVGPAPGEITRVLDASAEGGGSSVEYVTRPDRHAVRTAVQQGEATVGLVGDTIFATTDSDGTFAVLVSQAAVFSETSRRLDAAGLDAEQIAHIQSVQPPEQVPVGRVDDTERAAVGFAVGIVLYVALSFAGSAISTAVAVEKSTRISEVLLAVLRPSQIVVGTVTAVGTASFAQLLLLLAPLAVAVQFTDEIGLPAVAGGDLALAVVWFLLGYSLYSFLFAASAALVDKITEASSTILPVTTMLLIGYLLGIMVVTNDPMSRWSVAISLFPLTAPMTMPIRWSSGGVPLYQLLLAMAFTAAAAVLLVMASAAIYRRALLITGRRVRWREVLRLSA